MPKRKSPGHYSVAEETSEDEKKSTSTRKEYGVVRGDAANEAEYGAIGRQFGFKTSKWYAYVLTSTSVYPQLRFSPTAPREAFEKSFSEVQFVQQEFDTKSDAVSYVEDEMVDSYQY